MAEYIDREKAIEAFTFADADVCQEYGDYDCEFGFSRENIRGVLESIQAADVAPVVHGMKWISVEDRLPEEGLPDGRVQITVMACTKAGKVVIASRVFEFERKFTYGGVEKVYPAYWHWSRNLNSRITHWMPLPEPPKEI